MSDLSDPEALMASFLTLPLHPVPGSVLDFLIETFPHVPAAEWRRRIADGLVSFDDGRVITETTRCVSGARIRYFRSVEDEPRAQASEEILDEDAHRLVADKPHGMPTTPGGDYLRRSLLYRLIERTGREDLHPVHRLDRETAGVVLFAKGKAAASAYGRLFGEHRVAKEYLALARVEREPGRSVWTVETRLVAGEPFFRMRIAEGGAVNARTLVHLIEHRGRTGLFRLFPKTGKKHQLRVHLASLGFPILNDRYYPVLEPERPFDAERPLQLLASRLSLVDPWTGREMTWRSRRRLVSGDQS